MKKSIQLIAIAILAGINILAVNAQEQTFVKTTEVSNSTEKVEKKQSPKKQSSNDDTWTGFYIGGYGGFANNQASPTLTTPNDSLNIFN